MCVCLARHSECVSGPSTYIHTYRQREALAIFSVPLSRENEGCISYLSVSLFAFFAHACLCWGVEGRWTEKKEEEDEEEEEEKKKKKRQKR